MSGQLAEDLYFLIKRKYQFNLLSINLIGRGVSMGHDYGCFLSRDTESFRGSVGLLGSTILVNIQYLQHYFITDNQHHPMVLVYSLPM